ncbi:MAG: inositol monophosphatase [Candidatus Nanohalobium sp.]
MAKFEGSEYLRELRTAFRAAEDAGDMIEDYAENGFETGSKEDGSKVTEADRRSQEKIVEIISEEFPDDGFLGEEQNLRPDGEDRVWVIDPVDGTFNFDHGFSHYCVSIALKVDGEVVVGLVYSPEFSLDRSYFALKDAGAYALDSGKLSDAGAITVSSHDSIEDSLFFLTLFDIYEGELEAEMDILEELARRDAVHRQLGSCALEMCRVAAGEADFAVNAIVTEWDWAAAKLIIEEAGGEVRVRDSKFPDSTEVVSSNGVLQEEVEEIVSNSFR